VVNEFTTTNTTAQATAVSTTEGRVSQAREAVSVANTAFGMAQMEGGRVSWCRTDGYAMTSSASAPCGT
jgi:hypothetical protein